MEDEIQDLELPPQPPMTDAEKAELLYRYLTILLEPPPVAGPHTR